MATPRRMIGRHGIWMPAFFAAASDGGATSASLPNRLRPKTSASGQPGEAGDRERHAQGEAELPGGRVPQPAEDPGRAPEAVEAVDDAVPVAFLGDRALHVHGRVHRAEEQPEQAHREVQLRTGTGEPDGRQAQADQRLRDAQHRAAAQPGGQRAGDHAADPGDHRHDEQDQGELPVGQVELVLQDRDAGDHDREAQALDEERGTGRHPTASFPALRIRAVQLHVPLPGSVRAVRVGIAPSGRQGGYRQRVSPRA